MDTLTAAAAARELGSTVPRVKRAIDRLGLDVERRAGGRIGLDRGGLECLRDQLGAVPPVRGLTRVQTQVLTALVRAPRGLASVRALARRAGVSPTAAARALDALACRGLVVRETSMASAGRAVEVALLEPNRRSPEYARIAPLLAGVFLPRRAPRQSGGRVPARLRHLFWNTAAAQLELERGGAYVARRLLDTLDPEGLAWGVRHLVPSDWRRAARSRGLDAATRRMALNFARHGASR